VLRYQKAKLILPPPKDGFEAAKSAPESKNPATHQGFDTHHPPQALDAMKSRN